MPITTVGTKTNKIFVGMTEADMEWFFCSSKHRIMIIVKYKPVQWLL